ncbi:MAG: flagellar basal body rod protein FlgC [Rubrimonas sp.]|uniref:flagellar basal body rod protein FlgC n=1 Tax=Rubrimonas sp. TaxID=2036015 RepID=UPI002FDDD60B
MGDFISTFSVAASGMEAQSRRLRLISENIANADTPGFRRKMISFEEAARQGGVQVTGPVRLDQAPLAQIYDPGNPLANEQGVYDGSNVSLVVEVADAREAQRSYEANLRMFDQARRMSSSLLDLLKR